MPEKEYIYDDIEKIYSCDKQSKDPSKPQYSHELKTWSDEDGCYLVRM